MMENPDIISALPEEIKFNILSKLRIDEAVRCSVLAKAWKGLWRGTSHMELNAKHMVKPLTKLLQSRRSRTDPDFNAIAPPLQRSVFGCNNLIVPLIFSHSGTISSCSIQHFKKSLAFGHLETWVEILVAVHAQLKDLTLECVNHCEELTEKIVSEESTYLPDFNHGVFEYLASLELINYTLKCWCPFYQCSQLKKLIMNRIFLQDATLKGILESCVVLENFSLLECTGFETVIITKSRLKFLHLQALSLEELRISCRNLDALWLDSIIGPVKSVTIYAPCLRTFHSYSNSMYARMFCAENGKSIVKTYEILEHCTTFTILSEPQDRRNIFEKVTTMCIDLDLNSITEVREISCVLSFSPNLEVLEIALPVFRHKSESSMFCKQCDSSHHISMFWNRARLRVCVCYKLKFVCIREFRGEEPEVEFVQYLITGATVMKRITLICNKICRNIMKAAEKLFLLPRASANLFIDLKFKAGKHTPMCEICRRNFTKISFRFCSLECKFAWIMDRENGLVSRDNIMMSTNKEEGTTKRLSSEKVATSNSSKRKAYVPRRAPLH